MYLPIDPSKSHTVELSYNTICISTTQRAQSVLCMSVLKERDNTHALCFTLPSMPDGEGMRGRVGRVMTFLARQHG